MSVFLPQQRATLLIPDSSTSPAKHLFILLTNPYAQIPDSATEHNLIVALGTKHPDRPYDSSCCLYPGDHPFIKQNTYVNYKFSKIEETEKLLNGYKNGIFKKYDTLSGEIFARVCKGLIESRHTPLKCKIFYEASTTVLNQDGVT